MDTERELHADSASDSASDSPSDAASVLEAVIAAQPEVPGETLRLPDGCEPGALVASLREAVEALRERRRQRERRNRLPANVGKPWTAEQDAALLASFDAGLPLDAIAARLQRTRVGVRTRLERHGRLTPGPASASGDARVR